MALPIEPKPRLDAGAAEAQEDVAARIRRLHKQLAAASTRLFDLPGYGGQLVARYRRLTYDELRRVLFEIDADIVGKNAQFLIDTCDEILYREGDGSLVPIVAGSKTGYAVNVETGCSLGTVLGVERLGSLHAQVVEAFAGNEHALIAHAGEVHEWMTSANDADDEQILGES